MFGNKVEKGGNSSTCGLNLSDLTNMGRAGVHVFEICTFHYPEKPAPMSSQRGTTAKFIALCSHSMVMLACRVRPFRKLQGHNEDVGKQSADFIRGSFVNFLTK